MNNRAYCPMENCGYWVAFSGYFTPFLQQLERHWATHKELPWVDRRKPGGMLDQMLGEAIVRAFLQQPR